MVRTEITEFNQGKEILEKKGLTKEILDLLSNLGQIEKKTGKVLQGLLGANGWELERVLLVGTNYPHDAYKDRVMLEIDLRGSLLDAVHRNLLRGQVLYKKGQIDLLVQVVELEQNPKFKNVERDIRLYQEVLTVPICLIGIG